MGNFIRCLHFQFLLLAMSLQLLVLAVTLLSNIDAIDGKNDYSVCLSTLEKYHAFVQKNKFEKSLQSLYQFSIAKENKGGPDINEQKLCACRKCATARHSRR